jgi:hypothetical protein
MDPKAITTKFLFWRSYTFFLFSAHDSACGKKPKAIEIRGQVKKIDFFAIPKSIAL